MSQPAIEPGLEITGEQQRLRAAIAEPVATRSDPAAFEASRRRRSFRRWFTDTGWRHVVAAVVSAFAIFPLLYVLSASLKPQGTLTGSNQLFSQFSLDSYARIL